MIAVTTCAVPARTAGVGHGFACAAATAELPTDFVTVINIQITGRAVAGAQIPFQNQINVLNATAVFAETLAGTLAGITVWIEVMAAWSEYVDAVVTGVVVGKVGLLAGASRRDTGFAIVATGAALFT